MQCRSLLLGGFHVGDRLAVHVGGLLVPGRQPDGNEFTVFRGVLRYRVGVQLHGWNLRRDVLRGILLCRGVAVGYTDRMRHGQLLRRWQREYSAVSGWCVRIGNDADNGELYQCMQRGTIWYRFTNWSGMHGRVHCGILLSCRVSERDTERLHRRLLLCLGVVIAYSVSCRCVRKCAATRNVCLYRAV